MSLLAWGFAVLMAAAAAWMVASTAQAEEVAEPQAYRVDNYNAPVPKTLTGAKAVSADEAKALMDTGSAVFIDVYPRAPKPANLPPATIWREPQHRSIAGAVWLANVGFGELSAPTQAYFDAHLARLTGGDTGKPLVFFCLRDCWMSWNAAKRAVAMGYAAVHWFSEGTDAWEESGYAITILTPVP